MKSHKSKIYLLLLLSSLFFMNFQCNDCDDELHDRSNFTVIPSPGQHTFAIGDTLFLSTKFSAKIELEFSGSTYDNSDQLINYRLELFEGINGNNDVIQARDNFEIIDSASTILIPAARTWEIVVENKCDENSCELEFGIVPQKTGYFGLALKSGSFGIENECQSLSLMPTEIASNGDNNFELFNDIGLSNIRIQGSFYSNPESEALLYFFKVIE